MTASPSKVDQIRALREARYARGQALTKAAAAIEAAARPPAKKPQAGKRKPAKSRGRPARGERK